MLLLRYFLFHRIAVAHVIKKEKYVERRDMLIIKTEIRILVI